LGSELSVAGFDDVYPAQYLMPSLTTVNQPFDSIAKNAIRMILEIREGKEIENQLVLPAHIVIRESTQTVVD
ncbi:LacI family transcriptional regulator, partial [Gardnerella vaginalis]